MYFIQHLDISNFKSFPHFHLQDLTRINLFIGRPNGGKTNLLEALSLFSSSFPSRLKLTDIRKFIRMEYPAELFYEGDISIPIQVNTNLSNCVIQFRPSEKAKDGLHIHIEKGDHAIPFTKKMAQSDMPHLDDYPGRILLLDNPDAHVYRADLRKWVSQVLASEQQFFMTTQSPLLLHQLMQQARELSVFVMSYQQHQSVARRMTAGEVASILENSIDVFLTMENYE